ncbi:MAG: RecX family transcriptional regulator [Bacteroides sp.]|nr:RecX family transcriptional regulator [Bacteroides sp.]
MRKRKTEKAPDPEAVMVRLAGLCARSEQCEADIRKKLLAARIQAADAEKIVERLRADGFINDARFAGSYARDKVRFSAWGRNKVRLGLMAKRIPSEIIDEALASVERKDYIEALLRAAAAKARTLDLEDFDDRARLYRHLLSRGFESGLASKAVARMRTIARDGMDCQ